MYGRRFAPSVVGKPTITPDEAVAMLNRAFGAAVVVLAEGGTILQFAGDAMYVAGEGARRTSPSALPSRTSQSRAECMPWRFREASA